jgi:hypothetical protein
MEKPYHHCLSTLFWNMPLGRSKKPVRAGIERDKPDLAYADDIRVAENINTTKKNTEGLLHASNGLV